MRRRKAPRHQDQPRAHGGAVARDRTAPRGTGANALVDAAGALSGGFLAVVALLVVLGKLPVLVLGVYLAMSVVTFVTYAFDKAAAQGRRRRIAEAHLHVLGLLGGWPGALLAQRTYRHKSSKRSFQAAFWTVVVIHCAVLALCLWHPGLDVFNGR